MMIRYMLQIHWQPHFSFLSIATYSKVHRLRTSSVKKSSNYTRKFHQVKEDVIIYIWLLFISLYALREFCVLHGVSPNTKNLKLKWNIELNFLFVHDFHSCVFLCIQSMYAWVICEFWVVFRICKFRFSKSIEAKCVSA